MPVAAWPFADRATFGKSTLTLLQVNYRDNVERVRLKTLSAKGAYVVRRGIRQLHLSVGD